MNGLSVQIKADPRTSWQIIKEGLHTILDHAPPDLDWEPGDLLDCLMNGNAQLSLFFKDGEYAGFYVTRKMVEEFRRRPYLQLWLIYKEPRFSFSIEEVWPYVREEAKKMRAAYIKGESPRHGWGRRLAQEWMTIYRRAL